MGFGPFISASGIYAFSYDRSEEQAEVAGLKLELEKNFYGRVLDFNWHKQEKSPNWEVLDSAPASLRLEL